ncbi:hypothetical protein SSX86_027994 [Deinandra increscens subsp. villosa]|uniref:Uncharacterized protein n=1 Tax=Deinandra increscens subsp. villosa TaxID=3103831 RepID=A0AAP0CD95_9ASTR
MVGSDRDSNSYIGVGKHEEVQLFYYFVESQNNPEEDPFICYIPGGPGSSALLAFIYENGPLSINVVDNDPTNATLMLNQYTWTKMASVVFVDIPAGTGFSYAKTKDAWVSSDSKVATLAYDFVKKFLIGHPKFLKNPLYMGGISYMGIITPIITMKIYEGNERGDQPQLNIQGYVLANPLTNKFTDFNSRLEFAHRMALISDDIYESAMKNCHGDYVNIDNANALCAQSLQRYKQCTDKISVGNILEPVCDASTADMSYCQDYTPEAMTIWANTDTAQHALNITQGTIGAWEVINSTLHYAEGKTDTLCYSYDIFSTVAYHKKLTNKNCRALIFCDDHDMTFPYVGVEQWITSLGVEVEIPWHPYYVDGQVGGYETTYAQTDYSLTFATIKGGSHLVLVDKPKESMDVLTRWLGSQTNADSKNEEVQLFYYFVESENNPEEDPFICYTPGGPGSSALLALLYENEHPTKPLDEHVPSHPKFGNYTIIMMWSQVNLMCFSLFILLIITTPQFITLLHSQSIVKKLPGYSGDLPFKLETGYIGVGKNEEVQLFYYFVESENNPEEDPFICYTPGGPGSSALLALLYENGPLSINVVDNDPTNTTLTLNQYTWTKNASVVFLDIPAGTGFSYAKTKEASVSSDSKVAALAYDFVKKFLIGHPKFLKNPLYMGGISYMGIVTPIITTKIYEGNERGDQPQLNIQGYILANPLTDKFTDFNSRLEFAHRTALISDDIYESAMKNCHGDYVNINNANALCAQSLQRYNQCTDKISVSNILEPFCDESNADMAYCQEYAFQAMAIWANTDAAQHALNVTQGTIGVWELINNTLHYAEGKTDTFCYSYDVFSTVAYHKTLTSKNCRALIFSGDHDMTFPYVGVEQWITSLGVRVEIPWGPYYVDGQVGGYETTYAQNDYSLTFATVKGGSHLVLVDNPKESMDVLTRWLASQTNADS